MHIAFDGVSAAFRVPECPDFLNALRGAAGFWPFAPCAPDRVPWASVRACEGGYEVVPPASEEPPFLEPSPVGAACALIVDMLTCYMDEDPSRLCLHGAAAVLGGRLVVFPGRARAGKSTLTARLAAEGHAIHGDDVVTLTRGDTAGLALGLAPRLRVPLPRGARAPFRRFVRDNAGPGDERYLYLDLPRGRLAPRGSTAPLGAIVLLDRVAGAPARLAPAGRGETLRALITQNCARRAPAGELLGRLHAVMDRLPRFVLRYGELDEAAGLLGRAFAEWPPQIPGGAGAAPEEPVSNEPPERLEAAAPGIPGGGKDGPWRRHPGAVLRRVDGELFLADADGLAIHHLNTVGAGIWNLLGEPVDREEAVDVLHGAFPVADRARIARDVDAVFAALAQAGLIVPADGAQGE